MAVHHNSLAKLDSYPQQKEWQQRRLELLAPQQKVRQEQKRKEVVRYALAAMAVFAYALVYMVLEANIGVLGAEIINLQGQIAEQENDSLRAEYEIGSLSSLDRIESYAQLHLGMVYPDINSVQYLSPAIAQNIETEIMSVQAAQNEPPAEIENTNLIAAWSDMFGNYFSALAAE